MNSRVSCWRNNSPDEGIELVLIWMVASPYQLASPKEQTDEVRPKRLDSLTTMFSTSMAHAQVSTQIGTLACDVSRGIGMIVMQKQTLTCTFQRDAGGPAEIYIGSLDEYGVAIGDVASGHLVWGVIAAGEGRAGRRAGRDLSRGWDERVVHRGSRRQCARRRYRARLLAPAHFRAGPNGREHRRRPDRRDPETLDLMRCQ